MTDQLAALVRHEVEAPPSPLSQGPFRCLGVYQKALTIEDDVPRLVGGVKIKCKASPEQIGVGVDSATLAVVAPLTNKQSSQDPHRLSDLWKATDRPAPDCENVPHGDPSVASITFFRMMKRSYENALRIIETRRRSGRPTTPALDYNGKSNTFNGAPNVRGIPSLQGMRDWLQMLGHTDSDINGLNVIHVAGTKGKGSTCAFTRSFLQVHGSRTGMPARVGLYTSPDLRSIRERIQINNEPIREDTFAMYFFEMWDTLSKPRAFDHDTEQRLPRYLQLLALLAIHAFIREGIDAAVLETHHGGEYDSTNVVEHPVVTGITSIDLDHIAQLGPDIEHIAWHKSGIFRSGVPAFSAPQPQSVTTVLQERATQRGTQCEFVHTDNKLLDKINVPEVLASPVQRLNCSLALALTGSFLQQKTPSGAGGLTASDIKNGIRHFTWPGRFQTVRNGQNVWYLDGAHNELSVKVAIDWFSRVSANLPSNDSPNVVQPTRILIFTHFSEERDAFEVLKTLLAAANDHSLSFEQVIFTTYVERKDGSKRFDKLLKTPNPAELDVLRSYADLWRHARPEATVNTTTSIEEALELAEAAGKKAQGMQTLITGSLQLVGGALSLIQPTI